jgi:hypothetical protein
VLKQNPNPHIRVFAVWEPILPTDYSSPGSGVLARLSDPRVEQYWDKNHLFAERLASRLKADEGHPQPTCCNRHGIQWDEVAVYGQDALWDGQLPRAVYLDGPVVHALDFAKVVDRLLSQAEGVGPASLMMPRTVNPVAAKYPNAFDQAPHRPPESKPENDSEGAREGRAK